MREIVRQLEDNAHPTENGQIKNHRRHIVRPDINVAAGAFFRPFRWEE